MTAGANRMAGGDSGALTVGAGFAKGLFSLAVAKGAKAGPLLAAAGIAPGALDEADARIPFDAYVALMRAAKAATGDPALALHYGQLGAIARVSIVGLIGQASATMPEAFARLNRFVPLVVETRNEGGGDRFRLARDRRGVWLIDMRLDAEAFHELSESAFAQLVSEPRKFGNAPRLKAAHFTHADPGYGDEYRRVFEAPVVFGATRNALLFDAAWDRHKVAVLPAYSLDVLTGRAEALLKRLASERSVQGRLEAVLANHLAGGDLSVGAAAAALALSSRTLQRRLRDEGTSFVAVLDSLRHRLAVQALAGGASVSETAWRLGFSDAAAFSRAFKRWTGARPGAARAAK